MADELRLRCAYTDPERCEVCPACEAMAEIERLRKELDSMTKDRDAWRRDAHGG